MALPLAAAWRRIKIWLQIHKPLARHCLPGLQWITGLAQTFNNRSSALTGAAITVLALAKPFIAAGAAVGFIRCSLLFLKGAHGLVVPPRHWYFFPIEKGKAPAAMSGRKL